MAFQTFAPTEPSVLGERSYLTAAVAAAGTALTVRNNDGFTVADFVLVGELGDELSEIATVSALTGNTGLTVGALKFAHPVNTPVYELLFNQRRLYGATAAGGTYALIESQAIAVDNPRGNFFQYTTSTYAVFKTVYYNTATTVIYPPVASAQEQTASESTFYTTVGRYKAYAGLATDDTRDAEIETLIRAYTAVINNYLFGSSTQTLFTTTYTELASVSTTTSSDLLLLEHQPIRSITSIALDGSTVYTNGGASLVAIDATEGYTIYLDAIIPGGGMTRRKPLSVVYVAGYDTVPGDVELAMWKLLTTALSRDTRDSAGILSYSTGSKSVTYRSDTGTSALPTAVVALLAPYKRHRMYLYR